MDTGSQHANFYRAFEDRFRGSRLEIRSRLEVYNPFLEAIQPHTEGRPALDLGCGRGEWLELLRDKGFPAFGVDLDERMLAASREQDLDVRLFDAIEAISSAETASLALVSGFHIAEHLPFEKLQALISEAHRALMPGGLLILETPNPENLKVSSHTFHLDPTHQKPLPPALLQFMTEHYGFARSKIVRLQEKAQMAQASSATVEDVIFGVSPDYSVVAQKQCDPRVSADADAAFAISFGISDRELVEKFERMSAEHRLLMERLKDKQLAQEEALNHFMAEERVVRENQAQALAAMYNSTSWKITAPLRSVSRGLGWLRQGSVAWVTLRPGSRPRRLLQSILTHSMLWIRQRPRLARLLLKIARLSPALERRLILAAQARGMALSLRPKEPTVWHTDIEPEVMRKWENLANNRGKNHA